MDRKTRLINSICKAEDEDKTLFTHEKLRRIAIEAKEIKDQGSDWHKVFSFVFLYFSYWVTITFITYFCIAYYNKQFDFTEWNRESIKLFILFSQLIGIPFGIVVLNTIKSWIYS